MLSVLDEAPVVPDYVPDDLQLGDGGVIIVPPDRLASLTGMTLNEGDSVIFTLPDGAKYSSEKILKADSGAIMFKIKDADGPIQTLLTALQAWANRPVRVPMELEVRRLDHTLLTLPTHLREGAARALELAADILVRDGWLQHQMYGDPDGTGVKHCALGAIVTVPMEQRYRDLARGAMETALGGPVPMWNDAPGRTATDVISGLRAVSAHLAS